jgi:hypothetical protein
MSSFTITNSANFVEVAHTADWAIRGRGKTPSELFINVAIGMYSWQKWFIVLELLGK